MRHERRTGQTVLERMAAVVAVQITVAFRNLSAEELYVILVMKKREMS